jgi:hypothetical protein
VAFTKQCKFEFKAHVDHIQKVEGLSRNAAITKLADELDLLKETGRKMDQRARKELGQNVPTKNQIKPDTSKLEKTHGGARKNAGRPPVSTFNETNENIEWAKWTWNPVSEAER